MSSETFRDPAFLARHSDVVNHIIRLTQTNTHSTLHFATSRERNSARQLLGTILRTMDRYMPEINTTNFRTWTTYHENDPEPAHLHFGIPPAGLNVSGRPRRTAKSMTERMQEIHSSNYTNDALRVYDKASAMHVMSRIANLSIGETLTVVVADDTFFKTDALAQLGYTAINLHSNLWAIQKTTVSPLTNSGAPTTFNPVPQDLGTTPINSWLTDHTTRKE